MPARDPRATVIVREHRDQAFYEAKFRHNGLQVKRRIGPAWLERDPATGSWRRRRGRVADGAYDEPRAHVAAAQLVAEYVADAANVERTERERRAQGVTFREVALAYLRWLKDVRGAKPSTLRDHANVLSEPGVPHKRGRGVTVGHVMGALGDRPASKITTREVDKLLEAVSASGASPRTVNKYRCVVSAVFNYGCKPSTFGLAGNPAKDADKRREAAPGALVFYTRPLRSRRLLGRLKMASTATRAVWP
jgi:hypothetical protein